jgi:hypothetical protein
MVERHHRADRSTRPALPDRSVPRGPPSRSGCTTCWGVCRGLLLGRRSVLAERGIAAGRRARGTMASGSVSACRVILAVVSTGRHGLCPARAGISTVSSTATGGLSRHRLEPAAKSVGRWPDYGFHSACGAPGDQPVLDAGGDARAGLGSESPVWRIRLSDAAGVGV